MTDAYDVITVFDAIHDQARPPGCCEHPPGTAPWRRAVDGRHQGSSNLEDNVGVPLATYLYTVSTMHCMSVSLGLDGRAWARAGAASSRSRCSPMPDSERDGDEIESDPFNNYYIARKSR